MVRATITCRYEQYALKQDERRERRGAHIHKNSERIETRD